MGIVLGLALTVSAAVLFWFRPEAPSLEDQDFRKFAEGTRTSLTEGDQAVRGGAQTRAAVALPVVRPGRAWLEVADEALRASAAVLRMTPARDPIAFRYYQRLYADPAQAPASLAGNRRAAQAYFRPAGAALDWRTAPVGKVAVQRDSSSAFEGGRSPRIQFASDENVDYHHASQALNLTPGHTGSGRWPGPRA